MKLIRIIKREAVGQMCSDYGLYTRGDNESYGHLLNELCSSGVSGQRVVTDSDIEEIARDIVSHSDRGSLGRYFRDASYTTFVRNVAELIADRCYNIADICQHP